MEKTEHRHDKQPQMETILIVGGTTEGRTAVSVCEEAGKAYFYATRNASQQVECVHGIRLSGGLDGTEMLALCRNRRIGLIVDASHPFAEELHKNIGNAARLLHLPIIRLERVYPPPHPAEHRFDSFAAAMAFLENNRIDNLLALTGVKSISPLRPYWKKHTCLFRIMNRAASLAVVEQNRFPRENILFYGDDRDAQDDLALFRRLRPGAILTKESGETGGFTEKTEAAHRLGIPVLVIRRPPLPYRPTASVLGKHGLRKQIERLLPHFFELKTGYTTGSCATAAAKAALTALLSGAQPKNITILLPDNEPICLPIYQTVRGEDGSVSCSVIKDGGDDPDITHGLEIWAKVALNYGHRTVHFLQGEGVGRVTLPGLGLEIGSPAINRTPQLMIKREVQEVVTQYADESGLPGVDVTVFVPGGREAARKTFNPKLGIQEGISIIGTSGIVRPYSNEAFIASIRREMQVAEAMGLQKIIINSGAKSEQYLKLRYPDAPPQTFVQYGNFIGEAIKAASEMAFREVVMGIMIGKAVKLAQGYLDTHSKHHEMDTTFVCNMAKEAQCSAQTLQAIASITLARDLWHIVPQTEKAFFRVLIRHCLQTCKPLLPNAIFTLLLIGEDGSILS